MRASALPPGFRLSLIGSGILHVGLLVALVVSVTGSSSTPHHSETVITARLVRLGKERPKDFLPRKSKPPPSSKTPSVAASETKSKATSSAPKAGDRVSEMRNLSDALNRLKEDSGEEPEGHPDGSPDGEVTNLTQALVGNKYATEIYSCVKKHYSIEGLPPERVRKRRALVFVRVNRDGSFFDIRLEKGSGLKAFDRAVERAVKRCGKVSKPPKEILQQVREDGIEFEFTP